MLICRLSQFPGLKKTPPFHLHRRYPEEAPLVEVEERGENVDEAVLEEFTNFVLEQARKERFSGAS